MIFHPFPSEISSRIKILFLGVAASNVIQKRAWLEADKTIRRSLREVFTGGKPNAARTT